MIQHGFVLNIEDAVYVISPEIHGEVLPVFRAQFGTFQEDEELQGKSRPNLARSGLASWRL
jgi:hypothetical protein